MSVHENWMRRAIAATKKAVRWGDRRLPPFLRSAVGLLCVVGGLFGFLPVLGFWMIPVGLALIALDVPPFRARLLAWQRRRTEKS